MGNFCQPVRRRVLDKDTLEKANHQCYKATVIQQGRKFLTGIFSNPWSIFQSFCFFLFSCANFVTAFKFMGNQSTDLFVTQWITNRDKKKTKTKQKSACSKNSDQFWKGTTTSSPKEEKKSLLPAPQTHTHTQRRSRDYFKKLPNSSLNCDLDLRLQCTTLKSMCAAKFSMPNATFGKRVNKKKIKRFLPTGKPSIRC